MSNTMTALTRSKPTKAYVLPFNSPISIPSGSGPLSSDRSSKLSTSSLSKLKPASPKSAAVRSSNSDPLSYRTVPVVS